VKDCCTREDGDDLVVIGAGSAGFSAAITAAETGKKVALVTGIGYDSTSGAADGRVALQIVQNGASRQRTGPRVVATAGRAPNIEGLGLEAAGSRPAPPTCPRCSEPAPGILATARGACYAAVRDCIGIAMIAAPLIVDRASAAVRATRIVPLHDQAAPSSSWCPPRGSGDGLRRAAATRIRWRRRKAR